LDHNKDYISFDRSVLQLGEVYDTLDGLADGAVVPLADVPDLVWKKVPKDDKHPHGVVGGRDQPGPHGSTGPEHPTHYADIDQPDKDGTTLRAACMHDTKNVDVTFWQKFYESTHQTSRGCLPFRVWQFFDAMVGFAKQGDAVGYLTAAGILAHYVGDACQ